eukprot:gnl/MRDRNA2_/MRDRNA2_103102_c0_seq1.p1 gnl/MRDRNA2_/MRDRNA2_103102_c0~~gnl/MRDRNA2_/MRDRNA2_103102_c0_seq1.p1  ORF type:complete len:620 (-),score=141.81 gnl/MRDRNA2_/MRDRNA2_103102_c0_seq1:118-1977(-)
MPAAEIDWSEDPDGRRFEPFDPQRPGAVQQMYGDERDWEFPDVEQPPPPRKPIQDRALLDKWAHVKDDPKNFMDFSLPYWVRSPGLRETDPDGTGKPAERRVIPPEYEGWAGDGLGNSCKWSTAHVGCQHGDLEMLELASKEELEARDLQGRIPAHDACKFGTSWCIQWLVERGIDVTSPDKDGRKPEDNFEDCFLCREEKIKDWCKKAMKGELSVLEQIEAQEHHLHKFLTIPLMEKDQNDPTMNMLLQPGYMNRMRLYQFKGPQKPLRKPEWFEVKMKNLYGVAKIDAAGNDPERLVKPIGLLFPDVGSHYVKMLSEVKNLPKVKDMLASADRILGYNILKLCMEGPESKLDEVRYSAVATYVASCVGLEKLKLDNPQAFEYRQAVAGLGVGEYTALVAAGVLTFEEGLTIVKIRAQAMHDASGHNDKIGKDLPKQAMLSVAGLEKAQLESLCEQVKNAGGPEAQCKISMFLFPKGFTVSGTQKELEQLKDLVKQNGALQARIMKSPVAAFNTDLMISAQKKLESILVDLLAAMMPNQVPIYMGVNAKILKAGSDPKDIIALLVEQMVKPINWEQTVRRMIKDGMEEFYEIGPMTQLKAIMKRIDQNVWNKTYNVEV